MLRLNLSEAIAIITAIVCDDIRILLKHVFSFVYMEKTQLKFETVIIESY